MALRQALDAIVFVVQPAYDRNIDGSREKRLAMFVDLNAFVIMPLDDESMEVYDTMIKPAVIQAGFTCARAEAVEHTAIVHKDAMEGIERADIVIADLTGNDANVYYELAVAHFMGRPTIMITRSLADVPQDLRSYRVMLYEKTLRGAENIRNNLGGFLELYRRGGFKTGNPVHDNMTETIFNSVVRTRDVLQYEMNAKSKVCVLAPDIALGPGVFRDVMVNNIRRGVSYQYIIPNTEAVVSQLNDFVDSLDLGERRSAFKSTSIPALYIESDVTLIDPGTPFEHGFILAPAEKADYHYRVTGGSLFRVKTRFQDLWFAGQELL